MGKKGKKAQAGKPKKLTPKDIRKRLDALVVQLEKELDGADLFAPLPPTEDCPICLVPLSRMATQVDYRVCCGKTMCEGCVGESKKFIDNQTEQVCPFCREVEPQSGDECVQRLKTRAEKGDSLAWFFLGAYYDSGGTPSNTTSGLACEKVIKKDILRGIDCWIRATELGDARACGCISESYEIGNGVSADEDRALFFMQVGTLRGDILSRHFLGSMEYDSGNHEVGIRHWKIAAKGGMQLSLNKLKSIFNADGKKPGHEFISKEDLDKIYRAGHEAQREVKSEEREKHTESTYGSANLYSQLKC